MKLTNEKKKEFRTELTEAIKHFILSNIENITVIIILAILVSVVFPPMLLAEVKIVPYLIAGWFGWESIVLCYRVICAIAHAREN